MRRGWRGWCQGGLQGLDFVQKTLQVGSLDHHVVVLFRLGCLGGHEESFQSIIKAGTGSKAGVYRDLDGAQKDRYRENVIQPCALYSPINEYGVKF